MISMIKIAVGLILVFVGASGIEQPNVLPGVIVSIVGLTLLYFGVVDKK